MRLAAGRHARRPLLALFALLTAWIAAPPDAGAQPAPGQRWDGYFEMVSGRREISPPMWTETYAANGPSRMSRHPIDREGRYVVFDSDATNLGFSGTALYRRDRRIGRTEVLLAGPARNAAISGDGNHIAFEMCEPYMRPDSAPICDVWALDLRTWTWSLISGLPDGTFGNADSGGPVLSGDGRFVVFVTVATNLSGAPAGTRHVVLRDRDPDGNGIYDEPGSAVLETISVGLAAAGDADSDTPEVSDDGRFVAFRSLAGNLVTGDTNGSWDVFLRDRQAGDTRRLNVGPQGQQSLAPIDEPQLSMSADGRYVAFSSVDGLLAPAAIDDTNGVRDVFVYDRQAFSLSRVDVGRVAGAPALGNASTGWPTLTGDGRYVALESAATNLDPVPASGSTQVYVVDRVTGNATRIARAPEGTYNANADTHRASISADGTVVLFWSVSHFVGYYPTGYEQLFSSVHMSISPAEATVPTRGGEATYTLTTQQHTRWWALWDSLYDTWALPLEAPEGVGSGTIRFQVYEVNPHPGPRSTTIWIDDVRATLTQEAGLSLTSVTPASGPVEGGTPVTLVGTGFEPGMIAYFGGAIVGVEYADTTTLRVTTPPSFDGAPQTVPVAVGTQDGRFAWLDWAFQYTGSPDATPPMVQGWASGPQGQNGWYIGDVTITWAAFDPDSSIMSPPCATMVVTQDTIGATYVCSATSAGGTATASVTIRRDTTPPVITVTSPRVRQLVQPNAALVSAFTCSDAASGVSICGMAAPSGVPLDTTTPGWHSFTPAATDQAGNIATLTAEYAVESAVCAAPVQGFEKWVPFEGTMKDLMFWVDTQNAGVVARYAPGVVGQAFRFDSRSTGRLEVWPFIYMPPSSGLSLAMWIEPSTGVTATLLDRPGQFGLRRDAGGTITWTLVGPDGVAQTGTSIGLAPQGAWTHVALTYDAGDVRLYLNGGLDRQWTVTLPTLRAPSTNDIAVGNGFYVNAPYVGGLDELQIFTRPITAGDVEGIFLSGSAGVCRPAATTLTAPAITAAYGAGTYPAVATLRDANGQPLAGKTIWLAQLAVASGQPQPTTELVTGADGAVRWDAPFSLAVGTHQYALRAFFPGDLEYSYSQWVFATLTVTPRPTQITWATPAPITYGTALSSTQLNATGSVPGSIAYSPAFGTVLSAGLRTLQATLTPSSTNDASTTASVTLEVRKGVPVMSVTSPTVTYNGQTQPVTASARDYRGVSLSPVTITYNGATAAPSAVGVYTVVASFTGDANHEAATATGTLTINRATPTITFSTPVSFTYDGQPHGLVATVTGVGGAALGTVPVTYNGAPEVPVNGGTYTASATFDGNATYTPRTVTTTLTISKAVPSVVFSPVSATYDGQPHPVTATIRGVGGTTVAVVPVTYNGGTSAPVAAGSYTVAVSWPGDTNYVSRDVSTTFTIAKATPSILFTPTPATFAYDGQPHAVVAAVSGVGGEDLGALPVTYNGSASAPIGAGSYTVSATYGGGANYSSRTASTTLTIAKATPVVTVTGGPFAYDGLTHPATVSVTGVGGETLPGAVTVTYNGGTALPVNAGTYAVSASVATSANYTAASGTGSVVVSAAAPTVNWTAPAPITYGTALSALQLNAGTSVAGTFVYSPILGTRLQAGLAQPLTVTFTPSSSNYSTATVTRTIDVRKAMPTVGAAFYNVFYDGQPHAASASARGVDWELLDPVTVTYNGSPDPPVNAGIYEIVTSYPGSANYEAASSTMTREIYKRSVSSWSWLSPGTIVYGTPLGPSQFQASASVPGTFSFSPGPGEVLDAGTYTITGTFTPTDVNYNTVTMTQTVVVARATPLLTISAAAVTYDGQPHGVTVTATAPGGAPLSPVTVTYGGSPTPPTAAGTYAVVASYPGSANYAERTVQATLTIAKATPVLAWSTPAAVALNTPLSSTQLNATANVAGTFAYAPAAGTVLPGGTHTLTATFSPTDPQNYASAAVTTTFIVKAVPTVDLQFSEVYYDGQPHAANVVLVRGIGGVVLGPVTVTYNGSSSAPVNAGTYEIIASFAGNASYEPASATITGRILQKPVPSMSWQGGGMLVYGMPLTAAFLETYASIPGTFTYSPAAGTVLPAGPQTIIATFTPDDPNYAGATLTRTYTVERRLMSVRTIDAAMAYGDGLPAFSATFSGLVNGDTPASLIGALAFATTATSSSAVGTYAVTPSGLSSPNYTIGFVAGTLTIVKAPVAMTLTASPTPSGLDMPISFTATVAAAQAAPSAPAGTVRFFDGATLLGIATLSNGTASLLTGGLTAGSHTIEARYDGDASFAIGSRTATHVVNTAATTPAITITSSRQPASTSQSVTFTATITVATSGTIGFYDGNTLLGTGSIAAGRATLTVASFAAGSHAITARFQGDASGPPVISPVFVQSVTSGGWKDRTSTLSLVSSANPSALGSTVTFTATASGSSGTPAGRVLFMVDGFVVGDPAGVPLASGQAAVSVPNLAGGRHKVTATYLGSSNYRGSNGAVTQTVN